MNQPSELDGNIYEQLNNLYKYYENKYGNVFSSTIISSTFGNDPFFIQLAKGKRQVVFKLMNGSFSFILSFVHVQSIYRG